MYFRFHFCVLSRTFVRARLLPGQTIRLDEILKMFSRVPPLHMYEEEPDAEVSETSGMKQNPTLDEKQPKNVSKHLWEKFKALEKRTDEVTSRSTEKRIKELKKSVISTVQEQITHPDDLDILRQHDVKFGPPVHDRKDRKRKMVESTAVVSKKESVSGQWQEIKPYLTVNDHLQEVSHGDLGPKNKLQKKIDKAISQGHIEIAETLSDQLSAREFGAKIASAIDAKNYLQEKQKEEESLKSKRKKSLHWGFAHKQRWETKGNM
ncbi:hypothetical protein ScPMuIL_001921 [Solemya velum]